MKQYRVKEGCTVEENGKTYNAGQTLWLPIFRAVQLGLEKLEEVPEVVKSATQTGDTELQKEYDNLLSDFNAEQKRCKELSEASAAQTAEIEKLKKKK